MILAATAYLLLYYFVNASHISESSLEHKTKLKNFRNISDEKLVVAPHTFINDFGLRRNGGVKGSLREPPKYYPPSERTLNLKILDMMRQAIYDTQDNMKALDPILQKHREHPALRMAFIFERLRQLIIDIRRVYTLALKWRQRKRVLEQIVWYTYCVRKHIDVLYIVEHLLELHNENMELFNKG